MIPPDLTDVSQESPREACANLAMIFRSEETGWRIADRIGAPANTAALTEAFGQWASRLERACRQLDAEKSPRDPYSEWMHSHLVGADFRWGDPETPVLVFGPIPPGTRVSVNLRDTLDSIFAKELGAVSPTAPPAEQDTPQ